MTPPPAVLKPAEAAARYAVSEKTIRRAIASGALRAKSNGGRLLISVAALEDWFDALPDA